LPNEPRMNANGGSSDFPARDLSSATGCLQIAAARSGFARRGPHAKTRGKRRGECLVFGQAGSFRSRIRQADAAAKGEQGLRRMPDGTRGRCQGCLSEVLTWKRLLVGGLALRAEAAALYDHSLAMVLCWQMSRELQLRFSESRDFCCSGLPAANLLPTLRVLAIPLVTGTRRVNGRATSPRTNTLPKFGFSRPVC